MSIAKSICLCLFLTCLCGLTWAQSSGKYLNYQAIARDDSGQPVSDTQIRLRLRLYHLDSNGVAEQVTAETYRPRTDEAGFFQVKVGQATGPDFLTSLDWSNGHYELNVEWDPAGGTDYRDLGSQELLPVPVALHALSVENVDDADADPQNEFQYLEYDRETEILRLTTEPRDDVVIGGGINLPQPLFIRKANTILSDDTEAGQFVFGTQQLDYVPNSERGSRFFFDRETGAFRAGTTYDDTTDMDIVSDLNLYIVWDQDQLGAYSFASGKYTYAPEAGGVAMGELNFALNRHSSAIGYGNFVQGRGAMALGIGNFAEAFGQVSVGTYAKTGGFTERNRWESDNFVFVVGNGRGFQERSNALEIRKNGSAELYGPLTLSPSPYLSDGGATFRDTRLSLTHRSLDLFLEDFGRTTLLPGRLSIGTTAQNTLIGIEVASSISEGTRNTLIGYTAGQFLATGSDNTLVGADAGKGVITGNGNTLLGYAAGRTNTAGSRNVYIGRGAGLANNGSGNVFIGYQAGEDFDNANNRLLIDNNGLGSGNALIYGEFDNKVLQFNGSVGIGNRPFFGYELDVNGDVGVGKGKEAQGPSEFLSIQGQGGTWFLNTENTPTRAASGFFISPNGSGPDGVFHLEPNGYVGLGTSDPKSDVHIVHGTDAGKEGLRLEHPGSNNQFWNLWVSNNSGRLFLYSSTAGTNSQDYVGVFDDGSGSYSTVSDRRFKKDLTPIPEVAETLANIPVYKYHFKQDRPDASYHLGVMAQDLIPYFPELVTYDEDHNKYLVQYDGLAVLSIRALQEQQQKLQDLEMRVAELERLVKLALSEE
jgi:hypothetical protein